MEYCSDTVASCKVNTPLFRKLENITKDTYEVESCKRTIKLDLPIQVGFFVYQYAKLHMLQFYYDFLDNYLDHADFQMCEMNMDSAYIAISGDSVESLVKPELKAKFEQHKCTGSQEPTPQSISPMISELQGCSKWDGKGKESWDCVPKLIVVLGRKISLVLRVSTRNVMR